MLTVLAEHHDSSQNTSPTSVRFASELNSTSTTPVFLTGIQVAMHTSHEQHSTSQANRFGSDISGEPHGKPHELIMDIFNDHDMEGGAGK
jgi:hypothetical protein